MYALQKRPDKYKIIYLWKIIESWFQTSLFQLHVHTHNVETDPAQYCMSTWADKTRSPITALDGELYECSIDCITICVWYLLVL